jgi:hypothetical protein
VQGGCTLRPGHGRQTQPLVSSGSCASVRCPRKAAVRAFRACMVLSCSRLRRGEHEPEVPIRPRFEGRSDTDQFADRAQRTGNAH